METWIMVGATRARTAERPTQPSLNLTSRAPWFYPDRDSAVGRTQHESCPRFEPDSPVQTHNQITKNAAREGGDCDLVAGAGFEPATFGL